MKNRNNRNNTTLTTVEHLIFNCSLFGAFCCLLTLFSLSSAPVHVVLGGNTAAAHIVPVFAAGAVLFAVIGAAEKLAEHYLHR